MNLNSHDVELHSMYAAIPPYWQEEEESSGIDVSQIPYFILSLALVVLFVLMLAGTIQPAMVIVALLVAFTKCF